MLFSEPKIPQSPQIVYSPCSRFVSVLFSEPKIPQYARCVNARCIVAVSVLFSEPKIPQSYGDLPIERLKPGFSALQRAENSSMNARSVRHFGVFNVSVLFSEPKIPQLTRGIVVYYDNASFQCSSASRKFLNYPKRDR